MSEPSKSNFWKDSWNAIASAVAKIIRWAVLIAIVIAICFITVKPINHKIFDVEVDNIKAVMLPVCMENACVLPDHSWVLVNKSTLKIDGQFIEIFNVDVEAHVKPSVIRMPIDHILAIRVGY